MHSSIVDGQYRGNNYYSHDDRDYYEANEDSEEYEQEGETTDRDFVESIVDNILARHP